jgi:hypothetical protein
VAIPDKCGLEWDSEYPLTPDSSWDWVDMESDDPKSQPVVPYSWPENGAEATIKTVVSIGMSPQLFEPEPPIEDDSAATTRGITIGTLALVAAVVSLI